MKKGFIKAAAALFIGASSIALAYAASPAIEAAKSQCVIGEQADGYLGVVRGAKPGDDLLREMRATNIQRKAIYADLAAKNGVTIEAAAKLTAEQLLNRAPPGQCIKTGSGEWVKKP